MSGEAFKFGNMVGRLEALDKNGEPPELIYLCSRGRGVGKTTAVAGFLYDIWNPENPQTVPHTTNKGKFVLYTRLKSDIKTVAPGIMKTMLDIYHPGESVVEVDRGAYGEIFLQRPALADLDSDEEIEVGKIKTERTSVGYTIPLYNPDKIKNISNTFSDSVVAMFDEFMTLGGATEAEVEAFKSIHTSISRGAGLPFRYYPVYLLSNTISITNAYFVASGLTSKIQSDTRRYRGDGFVYHRVENAGISKAQDERPMSRAFPNLKSSNFADNSWVNDSGAAIEKPADDWGRPQYVTTVENRGDAFGLLYYGDVGLLYMSHNVSKNAPTRFRMTIDDDSDAVLLRTSAVGKQVRAYIDRGRMRFQSQTCKNVAFEFLV